MKKPVLLFLFFVLTYVSLLAQSSGRSPKEQSNGSSEEITFIVVEQMPEFPGGDGAMEKFLNKNMEYPKAAKQKGIQGTVYVSLLIDPTGKVTEPKVLRSPDDSLSEEALRLVNLMPPWKPGMQNGKTVRVKFNIPVRFRL